MTLYPFKVTNQLQTGLRNDQPGKHYLWCSFVQPLGLELYLGVSL